MRDALNATGRRIVFNMCVWGVADPWVWGPEVWNIASGLLPSEGRALGINFSDQD